MPALDAVRMEQRARAVALKQAALSGTAAWRRLVAAPSARAHDQGQSLRAVKPVVPVQEQSTRESVVCACACGGSTW